MRKNPSSPKRLLKTVSLAAVIFMTVSGGSYGLEPLLQYAGKNNALLLLLLVPLLWDLPTILMVLELNSMMPVEGGYYKWVNRALGRRWAFYEGWWTWLYSFTDLAIYPVLFVTYASFFFPAILAWKVPVCIILIWASAGLNILGIVPVGRLSILLGAVVLAPFVILFGTTLYNSSFHFSLPSPSLNNIGFSALGMSLYTVMWNFLGWDNTTTYAGEVDKPVRSYIVSTFMAFAIVIVLYSLTVIVSQNSGIDFTKLSEEGYPLLGEKTGGQSLAALLSIGGMASALGIFSAVILSISRIPKAMADDKFLPTSLCKLHPRFNTPYISIIICAAVVSFMILWTFTDLIVIDVILYGAGIFLEFISLIVLRIKEPATLRPFKIPMNVLLLCLIAALPLGIYIIAILPLLNGSGSSGTPAYFAIAALLTAEAGWLLTKWRKKQVGGD